MAKQQTTPAAELVEDFDLYPRHDVDSLHVTYMVDSLAAGEDLPPVIADRKTKRIVDGFHRRRAFIRHGGESVEVPVIWKDYKNDGELYLDAIRLNSAHGRRLTSVDAVRVASKAEALGLSVAVVASALRMTTEKVEGLVVSRSARTPAGLHVPLKRTIKHMAGRKLTKAQESANDKLSGMNALFYVNQLILLLENDLMPVEDENLTAGLQRLHGLLELHVGAAA
jgi:hypothetical protein